MRAVATTERAGVRLPNAAPPVLLVSVMLSGFAAVGCSGVGLGVEEQAGSSAGLRSTSTSTSIVITGRTDGLRSEPDTAGSNGSSTPVDGAVSSNLAIRERRSPTVIEGADAIDAAIGERDLCAVYDSLSLLQIPSSPAARNRVIEFVHDSMARSSEFADSGIRADWNMLLDVIGTISGGAGGAEPTDAEVAAVLDGPEFATAQRHVETWMDANCE